MAPYSCDDVLNHEGKQARVAGTCWIEIALPTWFLYNDLIHRVLVCFTIAYMNIISLICLRVYTTFLSHNTIQLLLKGDSEALAASVKDCGN